MTTSSPPVRPPPRPRSLVERAAIAAWLNDAGETIGCEAWERLDEETRARFVGYARAILRTVREPLQELHSAFSIALGQPPCARSSHGTDAESRPETTAN